MSADGKDLDPGRGAISPEERAALKSRASALGKRLSEVEARNAPPSDSGSRARGAAFGQAFKIAIELVLGVAVGGFIGWALDRQFRTGPWLLIVFLIFGFCAGMLNVIRTARKMQAQVEALQRSARPVRDDEDR